MVETINIGDVVYFLRLSEFLMADKTHKIEARVEKVTIDGLHQYKEDDPVYIFTVGEQTSNSPAKNLFANKEDAFREARNRLLNVAMRDMEEEAKIAAEEAKIAAEKAAKEEEEKIRKVENGEGNVPFPQKPLGTATSLAKDGKERRSATGA